MIAAGTRALDDLRRRWRPARSETLATLGALLRCLDAEARFETEATTVAGVTPAEAFGDPVVPPEVRRDLEWHVLARHVDRVGLRLPEVFDPRDGAPGWWVDQSKILAELGMGGKRK